MKRYLILPFVAAAMATTASAVTINFGSPLGSANLSDGTPMPETFTFELGYFATDFTPTTANAADWSANFLSAGLANNEALWLSAGEPAPYDHLGSFAGSTIVQTGDPQGNLGYIWGYDNQAAGGEWILFTNADWTFPEPNPAQSDQWTTDQAGTTTVVGVFNHTTPEGLDPLQATMQTQVIPEPSTYALIFGLGALGFIGYRRFRK